MTYVTDSGDVWDLISFKALGDCKYMEQIINLNRDQIGYFIFPAGIELQLPDIKQEPKPVKLPPWRR